MQSHADTHVLTKQYPMYIYIYGEARNRFPTYVKGKIKMQTSCKSVAQLHTQKGKNVKTILLFESFSVTKARNRITEKRDSGKGNRIVKLCDNISS